MFHVPGWDISAKSLVREQPEAKARKNIADPGQAKKRQRTQPETHRSRKIGGNDLEKLWNQRFGSNGEHGLIEDSTLRQHGKKKDSDQARSKSNRLPLHHANAGGEHATGSEQRISSDCNGDGNVSRKQKKLRNLLKRKEQETHNAPVVTDTTTPIHETKHEPDSRTSDGRNGPNRILEQAPNKSKQKMKSEQPTSPPDAKSTDAHKELRANSLSPPLQHKPETDPKSQKSIPPTITTTIHQQPRNHGATSRPTISSTTHPTTTTLTPLQSKMAFKLTSARFRHLNQQLYTTPSSTSLNLFTNQPSLFTEYHTGFTNSTLTWPTNPITLLTSTLLTRRDLPRRKTGSCTIADLGCGDAPLARSLIPSSAKKLSLQIHSYDLYAANKHVTVADISHLPLRDGEADIAIFCLSLMGTNWIDFVEECWRILRGDGKGEVWVAEVKSRFGRVIRRPKGTAVENSVGNRKRKQQPKQKQNADEEAEGVLDEELFAENANTSQEGGSADATDITAFVQVFQRRGFKLKEDSVDKSNKMFVSMVFHKTGVPTAGKHKRLKWNGKEYQKQHGGKMKFTTDDGDDDHVDPRDEAKVLKPCVYKTR